MMFALRSKNAGTWLPKSFARPPLRALVLQESFGAVDRLVPRRSCLRFGDALVEDADGGGGCILVVILERARKLTHPANLHLRAARHQARVQRFRA